MCDYSLEARVSRPAEIGERVLTTGFPGTPTRGFCSPNDKDVAVCLLPGTELAFDAPIRTRGPAQLLAWLFGRSGPRVAVFRKVGENNPSIHHDALELANGKIVLLTNLCEGQTAKILQLPPPVERRSEQYRPAFTEEFAPLATTR